MSNLTTSPFFPPEEDARFEIIRAQAENHWKEQFPKYVKQLEKSGKLQSTLDGVAERTILTLHQCQEAGLADDQARELANDAWLMPS